MPNVYSYRRLGLRTTRRLEVRSQGTLCHLTSGLMFVRQADEHLSGLDCPATGLVDHLINKAKLPRDDETVMHAIGRRVRHSFISYS